MYKAVRYNWADPETKILFIRVTEHDKKALGADATKILAAVRVHQLNPTYTVETAPGAILSIEEI